MGVYIPNMEMPTSCLECRLYNDPWCMAKNRNQWRTAYNRPPKGERQNDCPLVPVPPHGRLIDADALENEAQMRLLECIKYDNQFQKPYEVMRAIALAPTIIPAEEVKK